CTYYTNSGNENFAILFLNLDGFKPINDTYGHDAGDTVLKVVTKRLQTCICHMDTLARMSGVKYHSYS
ncbi:MAG: GGDEF domain-containing protein, partial [Methyloprofundus sp.]|nr:GGDEF domain-containing protein [Methyloprofundus sp.]